MPLEREVDQAHRERVDLEREHAADVDRRDACLEQGEKQPGQQRRGGDELILVARPQNGVAQRERAASLDAHQLGRGQHSDHGARPNPTTRR